MLLLYNNAKITMTHEINPITKDQKTKIQRKMKM